MANIYDNELVDVPELLGEGIDKTKKAVKKGAKAVSNVLGGSLNPNVKSVVADAKQRQQGGGGSAAEGAQTTNPGGNQVIGAGEVIVDRPNRQDAGFVNANTAGQQARDATANIDPVRPDKAPLAVIPERVTQQLGADRGFNTQATRFGAVAGDIDNNPSRLPSNGGTFNTVASSNPVAQLAELRKITGNTGNRRQRTGEVAGAQNSYARERNARLNDPSRQLMQDLDRQMRLGQIAPKNAYRIMQKAIASRDSNLIKQEQVAQRGREINATRDQRAYEFDADQEVKRAKLAQDFEVAVQQGDIDRAEALQAQANADREFGLNAAKAAQSAATDRARLGFDYDKLSAEDKAKVRKLEQDRELKTIDQKLNLAGLIQKIMGGETSGLTEESIRAQLGRLREDELINQRYGDK